MKIFKKKYLNSYRRKTELSLIKKYMVLIINFVIYLIIMRVNTGILKEDLVKYKLLLQSCS